MNIFASYPCPERSARFLDDARLVRMVLESCQMLSTVAWLYGRWVPDYPKPTHTHHPCVLWAAAARSNFDWLYDHCWALDLERRRRFDRIAMHKTLASCHRVKAARNWLPEGSTPHVNCARNSQLGIDFTHVEDTHLAYRLYLAARWTAQARPAKCTVRMP